MTITNPPLSHLLPVFFKGFLIGIFGLTLFYGAILALLTQDITYPLTQLTLLQPWISLLLIGFGIQMGLFWLMRNGIQINTQQKNDANLTAGTNTAVSGLAMVACCAHHAVNLLPVLGLSAAALFLSQHQTQLLIFGLLANLAGIVVMLWFLTGKTQILPSLNFIAARMKGKI